MLGPAPGSIRSGSAPADLISECPGFQRPAERVGQASPVVRPWEEADRRGDPVARIPRLRRQKDTGDISWPVPRRSPPAPDLFE